jgi:NAD(P)-dependent dehydrogenase (short-subunit alcohol dehydrogenase family)
MTRAAIVTGASRGIGLAIAHTLGEEGFALTATSRRESNLAPAVEELRAAGHTVEPVVADLGSEDDIKRVVRTHRDLHGRLDVLVNNGGMGIYGSLENIPTKHVDLQLNVNLRAMILMYRECWDLLKASGAETGNALVVNTSSITGKSGSGGLAVYSATKHGIVGFTQAMNDELRAHGVKSSVLCPGFVDTSLSDYAKGDVDPADMIRPGDLGEAVRMLLRMSPQALVPEVILTGTGDIHL